MHERSTRGNNYGVHIATPSREVTIAARKNTVFVCTVAIIVRRIVLKAVCTPQANE